MPGGGSLNPSTHETVDKKMHFVHQDGAAVFKFAVRKMALLCDEILKRNNIKGSEIDAFIPHQANKRIITATADRLNMRPEAVIINIEDYGNTTAGTIPLAMETARQQGKAQEGKFGAAGVGWSGIYSVSYAAAMGVLDASGDAG
jgi:3-oxoacyl-[acyl-carrier-protein] synthase-3